jgi:Rrf2 family protein
MKLSKRGEYALRALIDLGIASELRRPLVQVSELAAKEKLPVKFLEQIFTQLKAAGYVETNAGNSAAIRWPGAWTASSSGRSFA